MEAAQDSSQAEIAASWLKEFRFDGMAVRDGEAVLKADADIAGYSTVLPVNMRVAKQVDKETGEVSAEYQFAANSYGLTAQELVLLQKHLLTILEKTAGGFWPVLPERIRSNKGILKPAVFAIMKVFAASTARWPILFAHPN